MYFTYIEKVAQRMHLTSARSSLVLHYDSRIYAPTSFVSIDPHFAQVNAKLSSLVPKDWYLLEPDADSGNHSLGISGWLALTNSFSCEGLDNLFCARDDAPQTCTFCRMLVHMGLPVANLRRLTSSAV